MENGPGEDGFWRTAIVMGLTTVISLGLFWLGQEALEAIMT